MFCSDTSLIDFGSYKELNTPQPIDPDPDNFSDTLTLVLLLITLDTLYVGGVSEGLKVTSNNDIIPDRLNELQVELSQGLIYQSE